MKTEGNSPDLFNMVEVDEDAINRVEERKTAPPDEGPKKFVSPYSKAKTQSPKMSIREKEKKKKLLGSILGSKEGPSKKDMKKWKNYMERAQQTKKICDGMVKMIQVSIDMPEKTTAESLREQKFMLQIIQIGLDSALPEDTRTEEQSQEYVEIFNEEWDEKIDVLMNTPMKPKSTPAPAPAPAPASVSNSASASQS
eukprot:Pgem_evm1s11613